MNSNKFISIKKVINDIYYDELMSNCPIDFIVDRTVELMGVCGIPNAFENKEQVINIERYRAPLPCDFFEVNQVMVMNNDTNTVNEKYGALAYSTDSFHPSRSQQNQLTYKIEGGIITLSEPKCKILMSYQAFATDEDGYPMIIDNASFIRAIVSYVTVKWYEILARQGKVDINMLTYLESQYQWNVSNAISNISTPTPDQMESIARYMNSVLKFDEHASGFKNMNVNNTIKLH